MKTTNKQEKWAEDLLASAKRNKVEIPSAKLYNNILEKIEKKKAERKVPLKWVGLAAALITCLFALEVFLIQSGNQDTAELEIIPKNNNTLYYE